MGYSRHGDKDAAFFFKPHTGGGASVIGNDGAVIRYFCLLQVAGDHGSLEPFEYPLYVIERFRTDDHFTAEIIAEQGLCNIICGRAQATGDQNNGGSAEFFIQGLPDIFADVSHCDAMSDPDTVLI